jgi:transposase
LFVLHVGLGLSRKRIDVCLISDQGELIDRFTATPDRDGLYGLARRVAVYGEPVRAVVESMNGGRFVHDELTAHGWEVLVAVAQKVKGLAPVACKTDKIDARVLAEVSFRDLVPAIWLATLELRREREISRWRLHLVKHRSTLKNRVHSTLITFGHQRHMSDPGFGWITSFTVACELGDISRFSSPVKLTGYTGLCPRVKQSGQMDQRGPLSKHGPKYLRWG